MSDMLLILEPRGQRAGRGAAAGQQVHAQMLQRLGCAEALKQRGGVHGRGPRNRAVLGAIAGWQLSRRRCRPGRGPRVVLS